MTMFGDSTREASYRLCSANCGRTEG